MWSYRLNKIKSNHLNKSIANSESRAEKQRDQTLRDSGSAKLNPRYLFHKMAQWQHLIELFVASNLLAMLLALAEAQSWSALTTPRLLQYIFFINWVLLAFVAFMELLQKKAPSLSFEKLLYVGFILLQLIIVLTTLTLNAVMYFGQNFTLQQLTLPILCDGAILHLSYGVLIGTFCFRYLYLREQWLRQQNSELNARIQAMQARIHPHFLFNSLNNLSSMKNIHFFSIFLNVGLLGFKQ